MGGIPPTSPDAIYHSVVVVAPDRHLDFSPTPTEEPRAKRFETNSFSFQASFPLKSGFSRTLFLGVHRLSGSKCAVAWRTESDTAFQSLEPSHKREFSFFRAKHNPIQPFSEGIPPL